MVTNVGNCMKGKADKNCSGRRARVGQTFDFRLRAPQRKFQQWTFWPTEIGRCFCPSTRRRRIDTLARESRGMIGVGVIVVDDLVFDRILDDDAEFKRVVAALELCFPVAI